MDGYRSVHSKRIFQVNACSSYVRLFFVTSTCFRPPLISALALWWVIRRAKQVCTTKAKLVVHQCYPLLQCLDFSVTVYLIHTLICLCYGGFPKCFVWWVTNVIGLIVMAVTGEYLCMRTELAEIPLLSSGTIATGKD